MGTSREVVVVSGVRTAIGDYGGSLKDFPLVDSRSVCCSRGNQAS